MFHQFFGVAGRASNVGHGKGSYTTEMFQADFPQFYKAEMDENKYGEKAVTIERMARMEYLAAVPSGIRSGANYQTGKRGHYAGQVAGRLAVCRRSLYRPLCHAVSQELFRKSANGSTGCRNRLGVRCGEACLVGRFHGGVRHGGRHVGSCRLG